jgi:hypothetical protein
MDHIRQIFPGISNQVVSRNSNSHKSYRFISVIIYAIGVYKIHSDERSNNLLVTLATKGPGSTPGPIVSLVF